MTLTYEYRLVYIVDLSSSLATVGSTTPTILLSGAFERSDQDLVCVMCMCNLNNLIVYAILWKVSFNLLPCKYQRLRKS